MTILTLPDPFTAPAGPGFSSVSLVSVNRTMSHELNGYRIVTQQTAGQFWQIDIAYPDLTQEEFLPLQSFLYSVKGMHKPFYVRLPHKMRPRLGSMGNVSLATCQTGLYGNKIILTNWNAVALQTSSSLSAGDMIKTTDSEKVYMITNTSYVSTGSGTMEISIEPDLVAKTTSGTKIITDDIKFLVKSTEDLYGYTLNSDLYIQGFGLKLRETSL